MPEPVVPREYRPFTCDQLDLLAERLSGADPDALDFPNATVAQLLATLDGARKDLELAFAAWSKEADTAHRKVLDWQMRTGRAEYERNKARAELDHLRRLLGNWWTQWTAGHRTAGGVIDWGDPVPWSESETRNYVTEERKLDYADLVVGARVVGDWYDAETGPGGRLTEEEAAALVAEFEAAVKDDRGEYAILPPDSLEDAPAGDGRPYLDVVNAPLSPRTIIALRNELASGNRARYKRAGRRSDGEESGMVEGNE